MLLAKEKKLKKQGDAMYKEAEEGLISEGRDEKLEFARGVKEQPISERDTMECLFLIGSFCSRQF